MDGNVNDLIRWIWGLGVECISTWFCLSIRFKEGRLGFRPISLQKQNLGSASAVYVVDQPWGPVDRRHWEPDQESLLPIFCLQLPVERAHREDVNRPRLGRTGSLYRESTGQGLGRPSQL
eukprot:TRINITY_DN6160_c0_g5_i1.p1 TRINITY_DN6160_c0_g5~~TRINITY_DN6160_c0_g5_i1.p1  ORF type:complete len:120 (-),score=9.03 TRINITY_DN6160_c0_g5_i1:484-843(-)